MKQHNIDAWKNRIVGYSEEQPEQLLPSPLNWRKHPRNQQEALAGVLDQVGVVQNIICNRTTGNVVDGHLRIKLAIKQQQETIPVTWVELDEVEEKLILASLDPLSAMATTDTERLNALLREVSTDDAAVQAMLTDLAKNAGLDYGAEPSDIDAEPQIDKAKELRVKWQTSLGQLWQLGDHRLACGDCTDPAVVERVFDGNIPRLCVTDPPYGVEYNADWRNHALRADGTPIGGKAVGLVINDNCDDWSDAWALFPGDVVYSWHPPGATSLIHAAALQKSGFKIRMQIIWAKNHFPIGRGDYHVKHEPCWYCVRDGKNAHFIDDRTQTTLWDIDKPYKSETGHSTQKPIECMARPIRNHDSEYVYDPFVGSGTTIIACEQLKRKCLAIEVSPEYVSVTLQRFFDATGKNPVLLSS